MRGNSLTHVLTDPNAVGGRTVLHPSSGQHRLRSWPRKQRDVTVHLLAGTALCRQAFDAYRYCTSTPTTLPYEKQCRWGRSKSVSEPISEGRHVARICRIHETSVNVCRKGAHYTWACNLICQALWAHAYVYGLQRRKTEHR